VGVDFAMRRLSWGSRQAESLPALQLFALQQARIDFCPPLALMRFITSNDAPSMFYESDAMNREIFGYYKANNAIAKQRWFDHCTDKAIPYVTVTYRNLYADIEWDYITLPMSLDGLLEENKHTIENRARTVYNKYANPRSRIIRMDAHIIKFDKILISSCKQAAAELYDLSCMI
jgi:hypothetical protein